MIRRKPGPDPKYGAPTVQVNLRLPLEAVEALDRLPGSRPEAVIRLLGLDHLLGHGADAVARLR